MTDKKINTMIIIKKMIFQFVSLLSILFGYYLLGYIILDIVGHFFLVGIDPNDFTINACLQYILTSPFVSFLTIGVVDMVVILPIIVIYVWFSLVKNSLQSKMVLIDSSSRFKKILHDNNLIMLETDYMGLSKHIIYENDKVVKEFYSEWYITSEQQALIYIAQNYKEK